MSVVRLQRAGICLFLLVGLGLSETAIASDFNGDGRDDLAIGANLDDVGGAISSGSAFVLSGRERGLSTRGAQIISPLTPWLRGNGTPEGDRFSAGGVAAGDFNRDGREDLAVGSPSDNFGNEFNQGSVNVIYGARKRLQRSDTGYFHEGLPKIAGELEGGDVFGGGLTAGDFDGDGYDDLAIGASGESIVPRGASSPVANAGGLYVLYGARGGLRAEGSSFLTQASRGMAGDGAEESDYFGTTLAAGDLDADGRDELIAWSEEDVEGEDKGLRAGSATVLYGTKRGVRTVGSRALTPYSAGLAGPDPSSLGWEFGRSLASGQLNRDRYADLIIGAPNAAPPGGFTGAAYVLYGSRRGVKAMGSDYLTPETPGLDGPAGDPPGGANFAGSLAAGDLDADRFDDVAIGAPNLRISDVPSAGGVYVLFGSNSGPKPGGSAFVSKAGERIIGDPEPFAEFGNQLSVGNFNGRGPDELAISEPRHYDATDQGGPPCGIGGVHVLYPNKRRNLLAGGYRYITQDSDGMPGGGAMACDSFGIPLLVGAPGR